MDGIVGGDVAGMQGNHHVDFTGHHRAHITVLEYQARVFEPGSGVVAQGDHVFAQLHARHLRLALQGVAQVIVDGKGQVALARTEVGNAHGLRLVVGQRR
ncbi:hypothetical protein D3C72_2209310 [compost metagenome]